MQNKNIIIKKWSAQKPNEKSFKNQFQNKVKI